MGVGEGKGTGLWRWSAANSNVLFTLGSMLGILYINGPLSVLLNLCERSVDSVSEVCIGSDTRLDQRLNQSWQMQGGYCCPYSLPWLLIASLLPMDIACCPLASLSIFVSSPSQVKPVTGHPETPSKSFCPQFLPAHGLAMVISALKSIKLLTPCTSRPGHRNNVPSCVLNHGLGIIQTTEKRPFQANQLNSLPFC